MVKHEIRFAESEKRANAVARPLREESRGVDLHITLDDDFFDRFVRINAQTTAKTSSSIRVRMDGAK
jgi:hypothetical protein